MLIKRILSTQECNIINIRINIFNLFDVHTRGFRISFYFSSINSANWDCYNHRGNCSLMTNRQLFSSRLCERFIFQPGRISYQTIYKYKMENGLWTSERTIDRVSEWMNELCDVSDCIFTSKANNNAAKEF